jgi:hypothetical protein
LVTVPGNIVDAPERAPARIQPPGAWTPAKGLTMTAETQASYSIHTRELRSGPVLEVYFRHHGKQVHRRIGPAWTRRGRPPEGYFDKAAAYDRARTIIAEHMAAAAEPRSSGPTFRDVAHGYLQWLENVRGAKPETLRSHRSTLGEPTSRSSTGTRRRTGT